MVRLGGVAALAGGLAWVAKGVVILGGGDQPPLLFEAATPLFGLALGSVALSTMSPSRRRVVVLALSAISVIAGFIALASELVDEVWGAALAVSSVGLLIGLLTLPRNGHWPAPLAWWMGVAMVPAVVVGGALAEIDERLLEIPLVCLGITWMVVGRAALRQPAT